MKTKMKSKQDHEDSDLTRIGRPSDRIGRGRLCSLGEAEYRQALDVNLKQVGASAVLGKGDG